VMRLTDGSFFPKFAINDLDPAWGFHPSCCSIFSTINA
jgi:hypothetical protein